MRSLRRCPLNQTSERDLQLNEGMPARGIVIVLLYSLVSWTCLGAALWRCGRVR
jgi:hypothetical protein